MSCKIIDLSPASVRSSLRALAQNRKPHIPETLLAKAILDGGFPAPRVESKSRAGKEA
ncbi:hypothetical protein GCM10011585_12670 [Edaphobacter dinghuensis]|uniref:Uncharacterized protein n=1 Tax=Edaphobacter dinghuensis TaxID=1560005 RepID=A0A917M1S0_9BACT|nr:hypothetical protein GCM10011585_12670 [Edaphobacter dinghuensis]